jgi:hypothetical protein
MVRVLALLWVLAVTGCEHLTSPSDGSDHSDAVAPGIRASSGPREAPDATTTPTFIPWADSEARSWGGENLCLP